MRGWRKHKEPTQAMVAGTIGKPGGLYGHEASENPAPAITLHGVARAMGLAAEQIQPADECSLSSDLPYFPPLMPVVVIM